MNIILRTTTSLGLVMMMGMPSAGFAQAACGEAEFPCVLPDGTLIQNRVELLTQRLELQQFQLQKVQSELDNPAEDKPVDNAKLLEDRDRLQAGLAKTTAALEAERANVQNAANAEAQAAADARAAADAQAAAEAQAAADAQAAAEAQAAAAAQSEADAERQAIRDQRRAERQAERARARAESLAAAQQAGSTSEIATETLTESDVRSSSEEFETSATGTNAAKENSGGLSKFEKALIVGLGAVVVGKVLQNGDEVKSTSGDRVVVERDGELRVLKDDDVLLRRPGNDLRTETFNDGSSRTTVIKPDDTRIVTVRGADGTVLRRLRVMPDGQEYVLFDDTQVERDIIVSELPRNVVETQKAGKVGEADLRAALQLEASANRGAAFSLRQIRDIRQVRALAPEIELDAVRFSSGSAAIAPEQARSLSRIGNTLRDLIESDPRTVLLVEGHTDAVGDATYNLALSDRRAETVALALTEYFGVPEENMIVQGYGESQLKIQTLSDEQANRRAVVRNITQLLR